ncbi:unnamed protein product [Prunus brigantina]
MRSASSPTCSVWLTRNAGGCPKLIWAFDLSDWACQIRPKQLYHGLRNLDAYDKGIIVRQIKFN